MTIEQWFRERFKIPPEEDVPDYVLKYIPATDNVAYTKEELNWAKSVAAKLKGEAHG